MTYCVTNHSDRLVSFLVQHLLEKIELPSSHHNNCQQLQDREVFDFTFMTSNDIRLNYLPLLLEQFVLGDLLQALSYVDQLGVQLIDLTLLGQFQ